MEKFSGESGVLDPCQAGIKISWARVCCCFLLLFFMARYNRYSTLSSSNLPYVVSQMNLWYGVPEILGKSLSDFSLWEVCHF